MSEDIQRAILDEQRKTNDLLVLLIEALAEDQGDEDAPSPRYLDGTPAHG